MSDPNTEHCEKVRENRLRRVAHRQGLMLRKSRRRDPRALDYGSFRLIDPWTNGLVAGGQFGLDLDGVEDWLEEGHARDSAADSQRPRGLARLLGLT